MTAKEAIKHVRSKRKGCIQSKAQAEILYQLDKGIHSFTAANSYPSDQKLENQG